MAFIHSIHKMIDFLQLSDVEVLGVFLGVGVLATFLVYLIPHIPDILRWKKNRRYQKEHPEPDNKKGR